MFSTNGAYAGCALTTCLELAAAVAAGMSKARPVGLFVGTLENVADVGENASAAERFEPGRCVWPYTSQVDEDC